MSLDGRLIGAALLCAIAAAPVSLQAQTRFTMNASRARGRRGATHPAPP